MLCEKPLHTDHMINAQFSSSHVHEVGKGKKNSELTKKRWEAVYWIQ